MKLILADAYACGNCIPGIKAWSATHGISFKKFARDGIDTSELEHINDPMLKMCIEKAKERQEKENGRK